MIYERTIDRSTIRSNYKFRLLEIKWVDLDLRVRRVNYKKKMTGCY